MLAHDGGDRVGVGRALPAPDDGAGIVDDADGGRLERNVETDIMALLIHGFLRVAFDTAEVTGSPGMQPTPAITPCPVIYFVQLSIKKIVYLHVLATTCIYSTKLR